MGDVSFNYRTLIFDVQPEQVFDALINPDDIEKFMFGTGPSSTWEVGAKVYWKSDPNGEFEDLGQEVVSIKRGEHVEYTWHPIQEMHRELFASEEAYEQAKKERTTLRWDLVDVSDNGMPGTMLCLNHTGFDSEDSVMLQGVTEGWIFFVSSLKTHVERQAQESETQ
ncbi:SRPBCC domain-containing protein [Corynebacterium propinquum]